MSVPTATTGLDELLNVATELLPVVRTTHLTRSRLIEVLTNPKSKPTQQSVAWTAYHRAMRRQIENLPPEQQELALIGEMATQAWLLLVLFKPCEARALIIDAGNYAELAGRADLVAFFRGLL